MWEDERNSEKQNKEGASSILRILKECMSKLYHRLLHNFGWKIVSLISAFMVWMAIMNMEDPYTTITIREIPVTVVNETALQEQGKISDIESGRTVDIRVRAPRSVANSLTMADFDVTADFRQMSLVYAVPIQVKVSDTSSFVNEDISIESKSPEMMLLTLEDYVSEAFRVDIEMLGEAAPGYYVTDQVVRPNILQISGSKKQIERIAKVVVSVDSTRATQSFSQTSGLSVYDKNGYQLENSALDFEVDEVEIEVTVLPVKTIPLLIETQGTPGYGYECVGTQHVPTEITIAGTADRLRYIESITIPFDIAMQSENVEAKVNIENYLNEYYAGDFVLVDEEKYVMVKAYIEKMPTENISVDSTDIEVRGLQEGYDLIFTTKNDISIKVMGSEEILKTLTAADLRMYIDVSDYEPGSYYVSVYSDTQQSVTVRTGTIGIEIVEAKTTRGSDVEVKLPDAAEGMNEGEE